MEELKKQVSRARRRLILQQFGAVLTWSLFVCLSLAAVAIALIGVLWPWLKRLPLFRLPGDIVIDRPGVKFFFPITTMILISVVISLIAWLFRR